MFTVLLEPNGCLRQRLTCEVLASLVEFRSLSWDSDVSTSRRLPNHRSCVGHRKSLVRRVISKSELISLVECLIKASPDLVDDLELAIFTC